MRTKIGEWLRVQLPQAYFPFNEYTWAWKRKYIFQLQLFNLVVKALLDFKLFSQGWIEYEEEVRRFCWSSWLRRHFGTGGRQRMKLDPLLTICGTHQTGRLFLCFSHFCIFQNIKGGPIIGGYTQHTYSPPQFIECSYYYAYYWCDQFNDFFI